MPEDPAAAVELLCLDVDGVLTDGTIRLDDRGRETKRFHVRDGTGLAIWQRLGFTAAIITARQGMAVHHRAAELGILHVVQNARDKAHAVRQLAEHLHFGLEQIAAVGDDLPDLRMLHAVGYPVAVADAVAEIKAAATFETVRPGGHGAVREIVEHLLKARDLWDDAVAHYQPPTD